MCHRILSAIPVIVNRCYQYRWHHIAYRRWGTGHKQRWQELDLLRRTTIREKFSPANRSASNALTSRSSNKTTGNKTKRKIEYLSTMPRVMMVTFHLWNERLIFTSEDVPNSGEVFASTAELCSVSPSMGLPSPFVFYALVNIAIRFFDTDLSVLIRLSVIEF